jgi:hypothetical protein
LIVLGAGLLAGLAAFAFGEAAPAIVAPSREFPPEISKSSMRMTTEFARRTAIAWDRAAALDYGALGIALGLGLGAAGGMVRGSARAGLAAALIGLVLGGAVGAGTTMLVLPPYHAARAAAPDEEVTNDLPLALRTHGAIWLAIGAMAGLALGIGLGGASRMASAVIGGILGALVGAAIYEFGGAYFFPLSETFRPIAATPGPRLLAHLSVALCVSAVASWAAFHLRLRRTTA